MQPDIGAVCLSHLEFTKWADEMFLAALLPLPPASLDRDFGSSFKSLFCTLNHVYLAELVWLKRMQGARETRIADLASPAGPAALGEAWPELHRQWSGWAASLSREAWSEPATFRNNAGVEEQLPLWQIVLHVVNHGSYHRGQVAAMLRQAGITPPGTDLLTFHRARRQSA